MAIYTRFGDLVELTRKATAEDIIVEMGGGDTPAETQKIKKDYRAGLYAMARYVDSDGDGGDVLVFAPRLKADGGSKEVDEAFAALESAR